MLVIAHRGASGAFLENSPEAFRGAVACGALAVEFDVRRCAGELVVFHDDTLDRTTTGRGPLHALDAAGLGALRLRNDEPVPTLARTLDLVEACLLVNVEIKDPDIGAAVDDVLMAHHRARGWQAPRYLVSSFDAATTAWLATHPAPHRRVGLLYRDMLEDALTSEAAAASWSIHLPLGEVNAAAVAAARASGARVFTYTANEPDAWAWCFDCGIDAVFTDHPGAAIEYLGERHTMVHGWTHTAS